MRRLWVERACLATTFNPANVLQPLSPRCQQCLPNCDNQKCVPETSTSPRRQGQGQVGPAGEPPAHWTNIYSDQRATFPASRPRTRHATFYALNLPSPGLQNGESRTNLDVSEVKTYGKQRCCGARAGAPSQPSTSVRPAHSRHSVRCRGHRFQQKRRRCTQAPAGAGAERGNRKRAAGPPRTARRANTALQRGAPTSQVVGGNSGSW